LSLLWLSAAVLTLGCGGRPSCDEGKVWRDDACQDYVPGDPQPADGAWSPGPGTTWQWQLSGTIDTSLPVAMYDIDLFDAPDSAIEALRDDGKVLICYFSAGSMEDWRDDAGRFPDAAVGAGLDGWDGEYWIDVMDPGVRSIMLERLDLALERGCDGVEPDNVDGYANRNGLGLNATEQLDYNRFLADAAHSRGLSVGLKNDLDQIAELEPWFDWALNEECAAYGECQALAAFTQHDKAAFHAEYVDDWADADALAAEVCGQAEGLSTLIKTWDLGSEYKACPGSP
jgi:hypothetical protein